MDTHISCFAMASSVKKVPQCVNSFQLLISLEREGKIHTLTLSVPLVHVRSKVSFDFRAFGSYSPTYISFFV